MTPITVRAKLLEAEGRVTATVGCILCPWTAKMTADDHRDVAQFLAARFADHVASRHPDRLPEMPVMPRPS